MLAKVKEVREVLANRRVECSEKRKRNVNEDRHWHYYSIITANYHDNFNDNYRVIADYYYINCTIVAYEKTMRSVKIILMIKPY